MEDCMSVSILDFEKAYDRVLEKGYAFIDGIDPDKLYLFNCTYIGLPEKVMDDWKISRDGTVYAYREGDIVSVDRDEIQWIFSDYIDIYDEKQFQDLVSMIRFLVESSGSMRFSDEDTKSEYKFLKVDGGKEIRAVRKLADKSQWIYTMSNESLADYIHDEYKKGHFRFYSFDGGLTHISL